MTGAFVGRLALGFALALSGWGLIAALLGARRRDAVLIESARTSAYSLFALVLIAFSSLAVAIVRDDFSLAYVAANSSRETPTFFKILSIWSADEGSLLLWTLVLAGFVLAVAVRFRGDGERPAASPAALAVLYGVAAFYLLLVAGPATPFTTLPSVPADGRGPLPLLQNHPLMAIHPPMLYLGFIGFTVPFAFAVAALVSRGIDPAWVRAMRRWAVLSWVFLTAGLVLGALWSYGVLGWGGYWAWDPVENAALLPWLTGTALLHALRLREQRNVVPAFALALAVLTFALTVFGTFLTRGALLLSVHAFAESLLGPLYLAFLAIVLLGGFGLIAVRSSNLARVPPVEHALSREASLLANNALLLVVASVVLLGTLLPLIVEALTGERVSIGGPYFDRNVAPVALLVLLLLGAGPLTRWRQDRVAALVGRVRWPLLLTGAVALGLALAGLDDAVALVALAVAVFAGSATLVALGRAIASAAPRRTTGGLLAHLGFVVLVVGVITSTAFRDQAQVTLAEGERTTWRGYEVRFDGLRDVPEPHRRVIVATLTLLRDGQPVQTLTPSLNVYAASREPIGTPSLRSGTPANGLIDVYASLLSTDPLGSATVRLLWVPGAMLLWFGGALMVLGGLLAAARPRLGPPRTPVEARGRVRETIEVAA